MFECIWQRERARDFTPVNRIHFQNTLARYCERIENEVIFANYSEGCATVGRFWDSDYGKIAHKGSFIFNNFQKSTKKRISNKYFAVEKI